MRSLATAFPAPPRRVDFGACPPWRELSRAALAASVLAFLSGCGQHLSVGSRYATPFDASVSPAGLAGVSSVLAGALDEAPDEVFRILRPPVPLEPGAEETPAEPAPPAKTGRLKFGLRGGTLSSDGADAKWKDATHYGLYLRRVPFEPRRVTYELAANYAETERGDGYRSSILYTLHGDVLFGRVGGKGLSVCFLIGGAAVIEDSTNRVTGETSPGVGGGAEAGLSIGSASGAWEIRGVYTQIIATENANSLLSVSLGIAF